MRKRGLIVRLSKLSSDVAGVDCATKTRYHVIYMLCNRYNETCQDTLNTDVIIFSILMNFSFRIALAVCLYSYVNFTTWPRLIWRTYFVCYLNQRFGLPLTDMVV